MWKQNRCFWIFCFAIRRVSGLGVSLYSSRSLTASSAPAWRASCRAYAVRLWLLWRAASCSYDKVSHLRRLDPKTRGFCIACAPAVKAAASFDFVALLLRIVTAYI